MKKRRKHNYVLKTNSKSTNKIWEIKSPDYKFVTSVKKRLELLGFKCLLSVR